jgi:IS5 family transposase
MLIKSSSAANRGLRKLKTYLGRVIRDIERRIVWNEDLREAFIPSLFLARRVLEQERRQRGRKVYSLHAPEVECIGKVKAHRPYEFGIKVSVATTPAGSSLPMPQHLPGNSYDGHTLGTVIPQVQALIGNILHRCITDAGYRRHNAPPDHKFKVYTSGQKRRLTPQIKREFKRRTAIEPVIGHLKEHHRMGRNYLAHAINAVLAAAGYKFRSLLAWLRLLLLRILIALSLPAQLKAV